MEQTYNEFIQEILDTRGRFGITEGYKERHHIVPKCMGGTNDEDNLIDLTAQEHFIAHMLLAKENQDNTDLQYAFGAMGQDNKGLRDYILTPEEYEMTRIAYSIANSKRNSGKGNPMYGKSAVKGKHIHSEEFKQKQSKNFSGENNPTRKYHDKIFTEEYRLSMSNKAKISAQNYWDNISEDEYKLRCKERTGNKNGMYGKYGKSHNSVKVKCVETGEEFVSISDAERKTNIVGIGGVSKNCGIAGGYHWIRI